MRQIFSLAFAAALGISISGTAWSMGDNTTTTSPTKKDCKAGEVWDKKNKKCVKAGAGVLPDEELYDQGRALAKEGQYDWALSVLAAISDQNDPKVLNYIGYSHRKSGRIDEGIVHYQKALAIDPDFVLAREYLGEGYVASGKIELAKLELSEIEKRCGTACEEYQDLAEAIAAAQ